MKYYAAYGSNLNLQQMAYRCPGAKVVGTAVIKGYHLLFKGSGSGAYLTIEPHPKGRVPVAIWAVNAAHERALDRYEGFPTFYYKKSFTVDVELLSDDFGDVIGHTSLEVFAYIMDECRSLGIPSQHYVDGCIAGYDAFGFNRQFLLNAIRRSVA